MLQISEIMICPLINRNKNKAPVEQGNKPRKQRELQTGLSLFFSSTADVFDESEQEGGGQVERITLMVSFPSRCPAKPLASSQRARYQDPGTGTLEWNAAIINVISYTCAFPAVTRQNIFPCKTK